MKTLGFLFASLLAVVWTPGCENYPSPDEITGPDPYPSPGPLPEYPPPPGPPQCTITAFKVDQAIFVTSHGGSVGLTLSVNNAPDAEWAFNVRADVTARSGDQVLGEAVASFGGLRGGQSAFQYVELAVLDVPGEIDCTLSWDDGAGNSYSIQAAADCSLILFKAPPHRV